MCWKSSYEFILFNMNVFDLGSHSSHTVISTLCEYSCMVAYPTPYIFLSAGWLMLNVKSRYLCNEASSNKFCGWSVTGINPVPSKNSVSYFHFEVVMVTNEKCISIWIILLHTDTFNILICLSFLSFTSYSFYSLQNFMFDSASIQPNLWNKLFYAAIAWFVPFWHIQVPLRWYI